jgi:hypothetical protein
MTQDCSSHGVRLDLSNIHDDISICGAVDLLYLKYCQLGKNKNKIITSKFEMTTEVHETQESLNEITVDESTNLPPADKGKQAYLILLGCSILQLPVWGMQNNVYISCQGKT